jgi:hypothetical protein
MDAAFVTNIMATYRLPLSEALHAAVPGGDWRRLPRGVGGDRSWAPWRNAPFSVRILLNGEIVDPNVDAIGDALRRVAVRTPLFA